MEIETANNSLLESSGIDVLKYHDDIREYNALKENENKLSNELWKKEQALKDKSGWLLLPWFIISLILFSLFSFAPDPEFWNRVFTSLLVGGVMIAIFRDQVSENLRNKLSFGKYQKELQILESLRGQITERERKIDSLLNDSIKPTEKVIGEYCSTLLSDYFEENLYKKRSGNKDFEDALLHAWLILSQAATVSAELITRSLDLDRYKKYLDDREINHTQQSGKSVYDAMPKSNTGEIIQDTVVEVITPQRRYSVPRKIDWTEVNKARMQTGSRGENIVLGIEDEYLRSIGKEELADRISHVSEVQGDGLGYDILSFFEDGREKYIEVKSTTQSVTAGFDISRNELEFLKSNIDSAFIYRIQISNEGNDGTGSTLEIHPANKVLNESQIIPTTYRIKID